MRYSAALDAGLKAKDQPLGARDEGTRNESDARRRAFALGTIIALIALVVGSVFGDRGLLSMLEKRRRVEALRAEIVSLRDDNARLAGDVVALRSDARAIERLAREQLGLARPDETVFLLRELSPTRP